MAHITIQTFYEIIKAAGYENETIICTHTSPFDPSVFEIGSLMIYLAPCIVDGSDEEKNLEVVNLNI